MSDYPRLDPNEEEAAEAERGENPAAETGNGDSGPKADSTNPNPSNELEAKGVPRLFAFIAGLLLLIPGLLLIVMTFDIPLTSAINVPQVNIVFDDRELFEELFEYINRPSDAIHVSRTIGILLTLLGCVGFFSLFYNFTESNIRLSAKGTGFSARGSIVVLVVAIAPPAAFYVYPFLAGPARVSAETISHVEDRVKTLRRDLSAAKDRAKDRDDAFDRTTAIARAISAGFMSARGVPVPYSLALECRFKDILEEQFWIIIDDTIRIAGPETTNGLNLSVLVNIERYSGLDDPQYIEAKRNINRNQSRIARLAARDLLDLITYDSSYDDSNERMALLTQKEGGDLVPTRADFLFPHKFDHKENLYVEGPGGSPLVFMELGIIRWDGSRSTDAQFGIAGLQSEVPVAGRQRVRVRLKNASMLCERAEEALRNRVNPDAGLISTDAAGSTEESD